jgi:hypothetical protein
MTDTILQQVGTSIPLFDFTTTERGVASVQRNHQFIGKPLEGFTTVDDVPPELADIPLGFDETGFLILSAFTYALNNKSPVRVMVLREHWEYTLSKKPAEIDQLGIMKEVFCMDPKAVNIEFRPKKI